MPEFRDIKSGRFVGTTAVIDAVRAGFEWADDELKWEILKYMIMVIPEKTGALLFDYIKNWSAERRVYATISYVDFVEAMVAVHWTKPTSQYQARKLTMEHAEGIKPALIDMGLRREGLAIA